ncbi:hypothetical protein BLNAU_15769 [Blattamonas nauphoetae]|uniref:Uncharacterized protein n=1 Tax=Blattamonas nauphoetae TaxID=2049346 RepID=A0ABQ9X9Z9_9EUKA|nr:hypothetical protein BLNAU_15769 [Blattamonas nauphoetae]
MRTHALPRAPSLFTFDFPLTPSVTVVKNDNAPVPPAVQPNRPPMSQTKIRPSLPPQLPFHRRRSPFHVGPRLEHDIDTLLAPIRLCSSAPLFPPSATPPPTSAIPHSKQARGQPSFIHLVTPHGTIRAQQHAFSFFPTARFNTPFRHVTSFSHLPSVQCCPFETKMEALCKVQAAEQFLNQIGNTTGSTLFNGFFWNGAEVFREVRDNLHTLAQPFGPQFQSLVNFLFDRPSDKPTLKEEAGIAAFVRDTDKNYTHHAQTEAAFREILDDACNLVYTVGMACLGTNHANVSHLLLRGVTPFDIQQLFPDEMASLAQLGLDLNSRLERARSLSVTEENIFTLFRQHTRHIIQPLEQGRAILKLFTSYLRSQLQSYQTFVRNLFSLPTSFIPKFKFYSPKEFLEGKNGAATVTQFVFPAQITPSPMLIQSALARVAQMKEKRDRKPPRVLSITPDAIASSQIRISKPSYPHLARQLEDLALTPRMKTVGDVLRPRRKLMTPDGDTDSKEERAINLTKTILIGINQHSSQLNSACCSDKSSSASVSPFASSKAPPIVPLSLDRLVFTPLSLDSPNFSQDSSNDESSSLPQPNSKKQVPRTLPLSHNRRKLTFQFNPTWTPGHVSPHPVKIRTKPLRSLSSLLVGLSPVVMSNKNNFSFFTSLSTTHPSDLVFLSNNSTNPVSMLDFLNRSIQEHTNPAKESSFFNLDRPFKSTSYHWNVHSEQLLAELLSLLSSTVSPLTFSSFWRFVIWAMSFSFSRSLRSLPHNLFRQRMRRWYAMILLNVLNPKLVTVELPQHSPLGLLRTLSDLLKVPHDAIQTADTHLSALRRKRDGEAGKQTLTTRCTFLALPSWIPSDIRLQIAHSHFIRRDAQRLQALSTQMLFYLRALILAQNCEASPKSRKPKQSQISTNFDAGNLLFPAFPSQSSSRSVYFPPTLPLPPKDEEGMLVDEHDMSQPPQNTLLHTHHLLSLIPPSILNQIVYAGFTTFIDSAPHARVEMFSLSLQIAELCFESTQMNDSIERDQLQKAETNADVFSSDLLSSHLLASGQSLFDILP